MTSLPSSPSECAVVVRNLSMSYSGTASGQTRVVNDLSLSIRKGQFYTLLGPSGCGKTSVLRCIAGLEQPDAGELSIDGEVFYSSTKNIAVPANHRKIGMVFQSYAIWPHMTVFENVAFALRNLRPKPERRALHNQVMRSLDLVKLSEFASRPAPFLSGGQQQRLALARAIVAAPKLLLLDEPLSNLDAKLRDEMRAELRDLLGRLSITTVFVTHDQSEALAMSDTIAVMKDGRIVQEGSPADIYDLPRAPFVADFVGKINFVRGIIKSIDQEKCFAKVKTPLGVLSVLDAKNFHSNDQVTIAVRPENVFIDACPPTKITEEKTSMAGIVETVLYLGSLREYRIAIDGNILLATAHPSVARSPGTRITVSINARDCLMIGGWSEAGKTSASTQTVLINAI
jgi:iron(III) transport system ATP-binding protein